MSTSVSTTLATPPAVDPPTRSHPVCRATLLSGVAAAVATTAAMSPDTAAQVMLVATHLLAALIIVPALLPAIARETC